MAALRRIQSLSARYDVRTWASHWLCIILGAYFSVQLVMPSLTVG
jgi:hypothetical protein